MTVSTSGSNKN